MGFRFDLSSSSIVSYLISRETPPPRVTTQNLEGFLQSLIVGDQIISSDPEWMNRIRRAAEHAFPRLRLAENQEGAYLSPSAYERVLGELAHVLRRFSMYLLPVGSWRDSDALDRFAYEAAKIPGHHILVLIPAFYDASSNVRVLDPGDGVRCAIKRRDLWPGAIFALKTGTSTFLPLTEAHTKLGEMADVLSFPQREKLNQTDLIQVQSILSESTENAGADHQRRRLVHLSDLHLGTERARQTQQLLQMAVKRQCESVDDIVISGDLYDQPMKKHRHAYEGFINQMHQLTGHKPIVVPGNHDQRLYGNRILGIIGKWRGQLVDLDWSRGVTCNAKAKMAFFCFDSSRSEELARGRVDNEQLIQMATKFEQENLRDELEGYLRVAVVHHHPYPYTPTKEMSILDPRGWVGREEFVEMRGAQDFLSWCAGRNINLILHGHKHIPRLIMDNVSTGQSDERVRITTVGCGSSLGANNAPLSFNIIEWNPQSQLWSVDFQVDRGDGQKFYSAAIESPPMAA